MSQVQMTSEFCYRIVARFLTPRIDGIAQVISNRQYTFERKSCVMKNMMSNA